GDRFAFGGKILEFVMVKDMTCWVRAAKGTQGAVPRWAGGRMPLSNELAAAAREVLGLARDGVLDGPEMRLAAGMLRVQQDWSAIPGPDEFLVESVDTREGHHVFLYPFQGRQVHEGLAALAAYRLSRDRKVTISMAVNDYGIELLASEPIDFESALRAGIFDTRGVAEDILASLNLSEMAKRQFREIARVSGLVAQTVPGRQKTAKQVQASSGLLYDVFARFDPDHPLLRQAQTEVLERSLEQSALVACLKRIAAARLIAVRPPKPTPFAFPIMVDRLRQTVSSETLEDRIRRMVQSLEKAAG
ncbi:MAG: DNA ligase-associated DEXH box helicase, partial [Fimbriimonadaceae bacterium]